MQAVALLTVWMVAPGQIDALTHVGSLTAELRSPAQVAVTADGTVLVTDPYRYQIARFDSTGTFLGTWPVPECPIDVAAIALNAACFHPAGANRSALDVAYRRGEPPPASTPGPKGTLGRLPASRLRSGGSKRPASANAARSTGLRPPASPGS